ncbi:purine-nucleoside phosphorylase [bacterium]|jgi:purine-nucleoside phosphorylase|nr:purine-nucleoside phosphorylase [bacterium]
MEEQKVLRAADNIKRLFKRVPETAIVTGTGIKLDCREFRIMAEIPFRKIPFAKTPAVSGHSGTLKLCAYGKRKFLIQEGRIHFYESGNISDAVYLTALLSKAGVKKFIFINSAGSLQKTMRPGSIMLISDHINLMGTNPLLAEPKLNRDKSIQFVNPANLYSKKISGNLFSAAKKNQINLRKGVYLAVSGPVYETPAEAKAFKTIGADAVGMSTVPEAIKAFSGGCEVAALSCITNYIFDKESSKHAEIVKTAALISPRLVKIFKTYLKEIK